MYHQWTVTIPALTGDEPRNAHAYVPDAAVADDARPCMSKLIPTLAFRDVDFSA